MRQLLDDQVQEQPVILRIQAGVGWWVEQWCQVSLEALEQAENQRLFAVEVVVQIAWADAQFVGNLQGGNIWFALLVEQHQGTFEDTFAGFHPVFLFWPREDQR
ncbi:hypothetical protein D9M68_875970 [compost metagenome]